MAEHAQTKKLKKDHLLKWSNWIFGDESALFELPPKDIVRIAKALDSKEAGNKELVNAERLKLQRQSVILFCFICGLFTLEQYKFFVSTPKPTT